MTSTDSGRARRRRRSPRRSAAGAGARKASDALVDAVGGLVDHAIDRVLLTGERVTSAAEGKRLLAGEAEFEARADKIQKVVVAAVPVVRVLARGARFTRVPWVMVASSTVATGVAVRTGVRELQVLASLVAHRLEQGTGVPPTRRSSRSWRSTCTSSRSALADLADDRLHLVRLARRWVLSGAFGRNTSKQAAKALDAAERLDAAELAARWAAERRRRDELRGA